MKMTEKQLNEFRLQIQQLCDTAEQKGQHERAIAYGHVLVILFGNYGPREYKKGGAKPEWDQLLK